MILSSVILSIMFYTKNVSAGTIAVDCLLVRDFGANRAGSRADVIIPPTSFDMRRWWSEHCQGQMYSFKINGEINANLESSVRRAIEIIMNENSQNLREHRIGGSFWINSSGGDVEAAIRIGRMLRSVNASVLVARSAQCYSSCVFLIVGAVDRLSIGQIGIHRPYFGAVGRGVPAAEVRNRINAIDNLIERYLQDMNVPVSLLHAMKSVRPEDIQILSEHDLQRFMLSSPDPVWDELDVARQAWEYGTSSAEFRRRRSNVESRCFANVHMSSRSCIQAGYYGISVAEYQARTERKERICWSRYRNRTTPMSQREFQEGRTCERDVMIGVRR